MHGRLLADYRLDAADSYDGICAHELQGNGYTGLLQ